MKRHFWLFTFIAVLALVAPVSVQQKGGIDLHGPYDVVEDWLKPVEEGYLVHPLEVFPATPDRIFITLAGVTPKATAPPDLGGFNARNPGAKVDHTVYVVNRNGQVTEDWSKQWGELLKSPHDVTINPYDPEKHIWIVDRGSQQVLKFTNDGKRLVMSVGTRGVAGNDATHFSRPTEVAFLPDGTFFVSDGYDNRRVVKYDKDGKFLLQWDVPNALGEIHSVAVDAKRRVYVVDRIGGGAQVTAGRGGGGRVTIYDENGKLLEEWKGFLSPTRVWVTQDQSVWVSDGGANKFLKYDLNGKLITYFGTPGRFSGGLGRPHGFGADTEGNLYVAQGNNMIIDKYVPRRDADRSRVIGPSFGFGAGSGGTR